MNVLLLIILTQYVVKCDDTSNYYVIEMPEDDPPRLKKPFQVYWNVPTMQCKSKKIPFDLTPYGIIQNKNDRFRGESIAILYDPGLFPALLKNESSGELKFRNGGVPQEGDMNLHMKAFKASIEESIPDEDFSGVGIIDFESWRPVLRQNFGVLVPYKDVSKEIEKKKHPWWPKDRIQAEAKKRFEESGRSFMQTTLSIAKQMRPKALWGYYGFPYCFNMGATNMVEDCSNDIRKENDNTYWLWSESTALYPSVYSSRDLSSSQLAALIRGRMREASRARRKSSPVLPYFWFRYREGGYMSEVDLSTALKTLYNSDASGFIVWGSSSDVNTVEKCMKLHNYVEQILGPAIAKYTKRSFREEDEMVEVTEPVDLNDTSIITYAVANTSNTNTLNASVESTTIVNTHFIPIDPKFPWKPDANYSEEISHYVDTELAKKGENNDKKDEKLDDKLFTNLNDSLLMKIIINRLLHREHTEKPVILANDTSNNESNKQNSSDTVENTTMFNLTSDINVPTTSYKHILETSTVKYSLETERPYIDTISTKNPLDHTNSTTKTEAPPDINISSDYTTESTKDFQETVSTTTESVTYTDTKTENYDDFTNEFVEEIDSFYNDEILLDAKDEVFTTDSTTENLTKDDETTELSTSTATTFTDDHSNDDFLDTTYTLPNNNIQDELITVTGDEESPHSTETTDPSATTEYGNTELITKSTELITESTELITESTELITESTELITESINILKELKKESTAHRQEETNSTTFSVERNPELEQVNGSVSIAIGSKNFICILFYFFSVFMCICDVSGLCL